MHKLEINEIETNDIVFHNNKQAIWHFIYFR